MDETYEPCTFIDYKDGTFGLLWNDNQFLAYNGAFEAAGRLGNGYGWQALVEYLVEAQAPQLRTVLDYDSEAGMFVVRSQNRAALQAVSQLLRNILSDPPGLKKAIEESEED